MMFQRLIPLFPLFLVALSGSATAAPLVVDSAIPEPSTWLTAGCAIFVLTAMGRRR